MSELKDGGESINRKQQKCIHYSRMDRAENSICSVEDRTFEITSQREIKRSENSQCDIWLDISSRETVIELLQSQKGKRERRKRKLI